MKMRTVDMASLDLRKKIDEESSRNGWPAVAISWAGAW